MSLGDLPKLKIFYIHHNRLSYLPPTLDKLENWKYYNIQNNYFTAFTKRNTELSKLRDLHVSFNEMALILLEVNKLRALQTFYFHKNPFKTTEQHQLLFKEMKRKRDCSLLRLFN